MSDKIKKGRYSVFPKEKNQLNANMFLDAPVNVSRYDIQSKPIFEKLIEKQLSFFWRPEEIDLSKDRLDYANLPEHEKHIFISNLKYQTLLDSIQGRSPNVALLPIVSIPELETWIETWSFSETIHSRSYTHIIRNIINEPSVIFDDIILNEEILKRAEQISIYYDDLIEYTGYYNLFGEGKHNINGEEIEISLTELKKKLILAIFCVNILEAVRFYVSFACSFAFAESKKMEGNAKIIKLIARDEALHLSGTQQIINILKNGEDDSEMGALIYEMEEELINIAYSAVNQEIEWAKYLFKDGSMLGLNADILEDYIKYISNVRMSAIGLGPLFKDKKHSFNNLTWINSWLSSDNVQVAPQEVELSSYLVSQIDSNLSDVNLSDFEL